MELTAKKPLSQFQLISMIHRDKPPRMLVRLPILRSRESSTNQLLLLSLSVLTRQTVKSLPFMILEVELSIFLSSKSLVVSLRSRLPTVIPPSEEKISISAFKNTWLKSSRANTEWTLPKTSLPCKESERLPKKPRSSFLLLPKLKLTLLISLLMLLDQSISNYLSTEVNSSKSHLTLSLDLSSRLTLALRTPDLPRTRLTKFCSSEE